MSKNSDVKNVNKRKNRLILVKLESKKQDKKVIARREGLGREVSIDRLGSSHVPLTIRPFIKSTFFAGALSQNFILSHNLLLRKLQTVINFNFPHMNVIGKFKMFLKNFRKNPLFYKIISTFLVFLGNACSLRKKQLW